MRKLNTLAPPWFIQCRKKCFSLGQWRNIASRIRLQKPPLCHYLHRRYQQPPPYTMSMLSRCNPSRRYLMYFYIIIQQSPASYPTTSTSYYYNVSFLPTKLTTSCNISDMLTDVRCERSPKLSPDNPTFYGDNSNQQMTSPHNSTDHHPIALYFGPNYQGYSNMPSRQSTPP